MNTVKNTIYLDNNATTQIAPEVAEEMAPYLGKFYANPSSIYTIGQEARVALEAARQKLAGLIGAHADEIIFTSCGSESDNTAIFSAIEMHPGKKHIVSTRVEHHAVLNYLKYLEGKGYRVTDLDVDSSGAIDVGSFSHALTDDTAIATVMYANNETGVIFPIEQLGAIAREKGILFHTDAVQAAGKIAIDVSKDAIDMLSISGHKLYAPKGIGALYVRRGVPFHPLLIGGHQEMGRRAGTENLASIIALGKACELAGTEIENDTSTIKALRDKLEKHLLENCPDARLNGNSDKRLPNTTNISFEHVDGEAILLMLDFHGICASSGSACATGSPEPSHVLSAIGVPPSFIHGSIRFSLSRYTTEADVDFVIEVMPGIIKRLRELSPVGRDKFCASR
ncbi:MAG: cysteine desulfurase NifS [Nitrospirae bacterium]|nr:cysteine desulfurase NifS [Nitrospirota bacterium]